MARKKHNGYQGYSGYQRKSSFPETTFSTQEILPVESSTINLPNIQEPVMNVNSLFDLAKFLDESQSNPEFPEVTVLPDVLRNIGKFVNERKKMKYAHQKFEKKLNFLSDGLDKQYRITLKKIESETEIQLAQINGNLQQQLTNINRYYDLEMQRLLSGYNLQKEEMNLYYQDLEAERREQSKRFKRMIKLAAMERKQTQQVMKEAEATTAFLRKKIYSNKATRAEREHYMEMLKFRIENVSFTTNIITQLAARIK